MNPILAKITQLEKNNPDKTAIIGSTYQLSYRELKVAIGETADKLINQYPEGSIGLLMDNCPAWAVIDLACQATQTPLVPLPPFYTDEQLQHLIVDAGMQWILTDNPEQFPDYKSIYFTSIKNDIIHAVIVSAEPKQFLPATSKITYTSGTTGQPKGVCVSEESLLTVSRSLMERSQASPNDIHLSLTPLAVLLENIASIYTCILAECTSCILSLVETGLIGSSSLDAEKQLVVLKKYQATSAIVMPQMLKAMVILCEWGIPAPKSLRFLSVGGATVSHTLLLRAKACGLPVFQGYGLSECTSVVSLNSLDQNKIGSVGKILPHLQVKISKGSEIMVKGPLFNGYLNNDAWDKNCFLATGDIGFIDEDDYLYISGRKKNQFITSYGRNVSPEWVEDKLTENCIINKAFIFGEAKPWNTAILFSTLPSSLKRTQLITQVINQVNEKLPDYAQIKNWIEVTNDDLRANNGPTQSNNLTREHVFNTFKKQINSLYDTELSD